MSYPHTVECFGSAGVWGKSINLKWIIIFNVIVEFYIFLMWEAAYAKQTKRSESMPLNASAFLPKHWLLWPRQEYYKAFLLLIYSACRFSVFCIPQNIGVSGIKHITWKIYIYSWRSESSYLSIFIQLENDFHCKIFFFFKLNLFLFPKSNTANIFITNNFHTCSWSINF